MNYKDRTREQLVNESTELRQRIENLSARETGRRQADEALKVSEIRYRRLFETAQDGDIASRCRHRDAGLLA